MKPQRTILFLALALLLAASGALSASAESGCPGPKKRIAVMPFGSTSKYAWYEGSDVGEALAAQLTTALTQTGCFLVTERLQLSSVLREQELGLTGALHPETAAKAGRVIGAQVIIKGQVTEFEAHQGGKGFGVGVPIPGLPGRVRVGGDQGNAQVGFDLRIIDATTGAVTESHVVRADARTQALALGVSTGWASFGGDTFSKTPLGKAARGAIVRAVGLILSHAERTPWTGRVVQNKNGLVYVNAGTDTGIRAGDVLAVYVQGDELVDPETGLSLGVLEHRAGEIRVEQVTDKFAVARAQSEYEPQRGDVLKGL